MVDRIHGFGGLGPADMARKLKHAYQMGPVPRGADSVQLSAEVMRLRGVEGVRLDKVMDVRGALAAGTYVTDAKLDVALDRALDEALAGLLG